jgi:hypothetical protein
MHVAPSQQLGYGPRFARERAGAGDARHGDVLALAGAAYRYALAGDARPGDVLALAGGALMRDRNENGLIDAADARLDAPARLTPVGGLDVLAGVDAGGARRGVLVDVRG